MTLALDRHPSRKTFLHLTQLHLKQLHRTSLSHLIAVITLGVSSSFTLPVLAQGADVTANSAINSSAIASNKKEYQIAAGPLGLALSTFAAQAGVLLSFDPALAAGKQTKGLHGEYTIQEGFAQLLSGSGLTYRYTGDKSITLEPAKQVGVLSKVKVEADVISNAVTEGTGSYTTGSMSTATKLNLSIRETPQSVSVISRQQIEDQGLEDLNSLAKQIPGVNYSQSDSERFSFYARGFDISAFQVDGIQTSSHPDGAYQPFYRSGMDMVIYDHIEVVKGATGLTTGAGSPAASINLIKKRPTNNFQAYVDASIGSWDAYRTTADVSSPLNESGSIRSRLVGAYENKEHFIDYYQSEQSTVYGIVEADITDKTLISFGITRVDNDINGISWGGAFPAFYSDGTRTDFARSFSQVDDWTNWNAESISTSAELVHHFNENWNVKVIYNEQQNESKLFSIFYEGYPDPTGGAFLYRDEYPNTIDRDVINADVSGKFELFGYEQDIIFGISQTDTHYDGDNFLDWDGYYTEDFVASAGNIPQLSHAERVLDETLVSDTDETGVYGAVRIRLADPLSVIAGVRVSDWSYDGKTIRANSTKNLSYEFDKVASPYLGAVYDLNNSLSLYASYTDIFTPQNARDIEGELIDPIDGQAYEAGIKGEFNDGKINASAAVFQITQDNLAEDTGEIINGQPVFVALEGATSVGVELELSGEISPGWKLQGGFSHSKIEDANNNPVLTSSAENSVKLFTTYRLPILQQRLVIGSGISWQDDTYKDKVGPNNDRIEGTADDRLNQNAYALVDVMANYKFTNHLSASLNINNLFDKTYYSAFRQGSQYGLPRHVKFSVKYNF